nr:hypothetical protein CFP56_09103 [Quercus suber]
MTISRRGCECRTSVNRLGICTTIGRCCAQLDRSTSEQPEQLARTLREAEQPLHHHPGDFLSADDDVPDIRSKLDLTVLCEVEDAETGAFLRCTYGYVDHADSAWFGHMPHIWKDDLTVAGLQRTLQRIPDEQIHPEVTPSITVARPCELDNNSLLIKRPQLNDCDVADVAALLPGLLVGEAQNPRSGGRAGDVYGVQMSTKSLSMIPYGYSWRQWQSTR